MATMKDIIAQLEIDLEAEKAKLAKMESDIVEIREQRIPSSKERIKKASKLLAQLKGVYETPGAEVTVVDEKGNQVCSVCGAKFQLYQELADHRKAMHPTAVVKPDLRKMGARKRAFWLEQNMGPVFDGPATREEGHPYKVYQGVVTVLLDHFKGQKDVPKETVLKFLYKEFAFALEAPSGYGHVLSCIPQGTIVPSRTHLFSGKHGKVIVYDSFDFPVVELHDPAA